MIQEVPYEEILQIRHKVMYPDKDIEYVKLPEDHLGLHIGYYHKGELVSVASLFLENRNLQFRKLATKTEHQKKGYASEIINWMLSYAKDVKLEKVWCNSRLDKVEFYKKFGFIQTDKTFSRDKHEYVVVEKNESFV